ncbi:MAG TPA: hypothetical protein PLP46_02000 [bacterium]|jgi:nucleoside 2-deoxyribosyltransferase|nr:hypothetical protein [bacterium]HOQ91376.1 hypothetical protein [bacterium]HPL22213.1 hypothetical protein [bacterium]
MKIIICGSMSASKEMVEAEKQLLTLGHEVVLPEFTHDYAAMATIDKAHTESARNKVQYDLIRIHFDKIKAGDAILVVNVERKDIPGYIGGNSFLEMGFAFVLNKPIYLLYQIPQCNYRDEIEAMRPIVLAGDIGKIGL